MLNYDRPWWAGISFTLSILEINTGLICACAATLGPLWKMLFTKVRGWSSRHDTSMSSWPHSFDKHRRSGASSKSNKADRSQLQRHGVEAVNGNEALMSLPNRTRRDSAVLNNSDNEYVMLDLPDPQLSHSMEDTMYRIRNI